MKLAPKLATAVAGLALVASCPGGGDKQNGTGPTGPVGPTPPDAAPQVAERTDPAPEPPPAIPAPNNPPSMELPIYERIGVGQEIGFGLEVIDAESDDFVVELVKKPGSASYDPYTLTVVWKPTRKDVGVGEFIARITETVRATGEKRVFTHPFSIEVTRRKQPLPTARPLGAAVETLITIHDAERLAVANKRWPIDKMLMVNIERAIAALPEDQRKAVAKPDPKKVYASFLAALAEANDNPAVDPSSGSFDKAGFADPKDWTIIAVRPRLDKKWHEVRIVYRAKAHAATYAMFKMRPVGDEKPAEARAFNNKEFQRLVLGHFFTADGKLDRQNMSDKKRHAKKVADFLDAVIGYKSDAHPWSSPGVQALPCESRLGGGSRRDANGNYASGDGWGWNVQLPKLKDGEMLYTNVPIKGFASGVRPSADSTAWQMVCGDRFVKGTDAHEPGFETLCRPTGHTDLPGAGDGYSDHERAGGTVVSAKLEAANMFVAHKNQHIVNGFPLEDPRRDLFEEKGMTCSQCHVRAFGVRDMYDRAAYDPRAGLPKALNKKQNTTYFVIVPTTHWQPYAIDFQHKQECKAKAAFVEFSGVQTDLTCPLKVE